MALIELFVFIISLVLVILVIGLVIVLVAAAAFVCCASSSLQPRAVVDCVPLAQIDTSVEMC
jgi:hypothetical protein